MVKSMTGFGRAEFNDGKRIVTVEIRAVNHRFCEISVRMPRMYVFAEESVKDAVRSFVKRGKIDCSVSVTQTGGSDVNVSVNLPLAAGYAEALRKLSAIPGVSGGLSAEIIAWFPGVLTETPAEEDEKELTDALVQATLGAASLLDEARGNEGARLADDLRDKNRTVRRLIDDIDARASYVPEEYRNTLTARIDELLDGTGISPPEDRLAAEVAFFADKCSIAEEITRLRSHTKGLENILESGGPAGKKLDFLVQEMNREANTIGSKANDLAITNLVLELKSEIEKIREQVQNIE